MPRQPRRRSYDQHCAAAHALDLVGDRWTLLVVRELLAGPRRYTDLHADLPGVSTDMLAGRLKDMEGADLVTRRRLPPPTPAFVYELTARGRELLPVLRALAAWGAPDLDEPRPTDAVRAHWYAIPLLGALSGLGAGVVQVTLDEGEFHVRVGADGGVAYGDGAAPSPDARLRTDTVTCRALASGELTLAEAIASGRAVLDGVLGTAGV
ncbi:MULTISPECIES: winged helix-turn-helix transcriptional regulator [unclassified Streptomyces]|uniref:winged helix-turn-helix transcriptional regulator n=1 Tax=unclassified Streptomyces TaxID=2593676 RepID=UPI0016604181|nr:MULTISPECIES: winged helix-turn-helix transcriptional regulator [unclassified Streptomyces]MBD0710521.1 transcriptional regulator [Streptomyces sp. CBMA291]MBD0713512.1 transcriptional regulator [Streptomyces sp. CBMA370]